jgi:hypothetical protein
MAYRLSREIFGTCEAANDEHSRRCLYGVSNDKKKVRLAQIGWDL